MHGLSTTIEKSGWVNVSHPFNLRDLSWSLLLDLQSESLQHCSMLGIKDPIQECHELLHKHTCLIVIDGLQSTEEWDLIEAALVTGDSKSFIIVITNEQSVAKYCAKSAVLNIKSLEADEAFDLFKKKVYHNVDPKVIEKEEHIVHSYIQEIVPNCGGLPKVIVVVAGFLAGILINDVEELEFCCRMLRDRFMHLIEINSAFDTLRGLFTWVHSYFRICPDYLKPCIFYLSIFPVNHIIRRRRLVRRWIAEGYSRATKESTAEEAAEGSMSELVMVSMIHLLEVTTAMDFSCVKMPLCQVNGFFREYIMSRSMEENLVFALEGHSRMNLQRTGQHLAIQRSWDRDSNVFESIEYSRLRSLTVFGEWRSFFISDKMRLLRVLDLENTSGVTDKDLEKMVKRLPRLKFLSLRGCREITRLPDSLGGLQQLETLDVRNTSVVALPSAIIKLQKLEYVRAGTTVPSGNYEGTVGRPPRSRPHTSVCCPSKFFRRRPADADNGCGIEVPRGIGKLSALHTLGVVNINSAAGGEAILEDLKNLTQLHKLGVCGINQRNSQEFCSALSGHNHLESLSVQFDKDNQAGCLDSISTPPENLLSLKLYGLVGKLPVWIKGLLNLRKLNLQMTTLPQDDIDALGVLTKLQILCLRFQEFQDGKLQFGTGFSQLYVLEIACNSSLKSVTFNYGGKTEISVEVLKIRCCNASLLGFSGLEELLELTEVSLSGSYEDAVKQGLQRQLDKHPNKIVLKERKWNQVRHDGY